MVGYLKYIHVHDRKSWGLVLHWFGWFAGGLSDRSLGIRKTAISFVPLDWVVVYFDECQCTSAISLVAYFFLPLAQ